MVIYAHQLLPPGGGSDKTGGNIMFADIAVERRMEDLFIRLRDVQADIAGLRLELEATTKRIDRIEHQED